jgi:hypothetical protein
MAETKKQTIIMTCSIVGCIVTLITCGVLIGGMKTEVVHLKEDSVSLTKELKILRDDTHAIKEEQSFMKGVVSTQLNNIQTEVTKIGKQVDDLIRAD